MPAIGAFSTIDVPTIAKLEHGLVSRIAVLNIRHDIGAWRQLGDGPEISTASC